jgi:arabinose-5-phosphate isomerase
VCTLGLAPTTSSIMMLALGDALAIACLEKRKFTKNNFKVFHPSGKLDLNLICLQRLEANWYPSPA